MSDPLRELLTLVLQFDNDLANKVLKKYNSVQDFFNSEDRWVSDFGFNKQQFMKVIKIKNATAKALIEARNFEAMNKNFPSEPEATIESFFEFLKEYQPEIDLTTDEIIKTAFSFAFKHRKVLLEQLNAILEPNLSLVKYGGFDFVTREIIPKLIDLAKSNPTYLASFASCSDEIISYFTSLTLQNIAFANVLSGGVILGLMTCYSAGKRFFDCCRRKKRGETVNWKEDFFIPFGVDLAANSSVVATSTITALALAGIGSLIFPGVGTFLGGLIGSILGAIAGKRIIEPELRKFLSGSKVSEINKIEEITDTEIYVGALDKLNLTKYSSNEDIKKKRRENLINHHPDKFPDLKEEEKKDLTNKLIQLEANYKIVESYRRANNLWEWE